MINHLGAALSVGIFISSVTIISFSLDGWNAAAGGCPAMQGNVTTRSASQPSSRRLKAVELDRLVGPVAPYPDPLLAKVLEPSTHAGEIAAATEWANRHQLLSGGDLGGNRSRPPAVGCECAGALAISDGVAGDGFGYGVDNTTWERLHDWSGRRAGSGTAATPRS